MDQKYFLMHIWEWQWDLSMFKHYSLFFVEFCLSWIIFNKLIIKLIIEGSNKKHLWTKIEKKIVIINCYSEMPKYFNIYFNF
jgi:hypothetical protein